MPLHFLADGDTPMSDQPPFQGVSWVHSISAVSTPRDGTTSRSEGFTAYFTPGRDGGSLKGPAAGENFVSSSRDRGGGCAHDVLHATY